MSDQELIDELSLPAYAGMTDDEAYAALSAETVTEPYTRFVSLRGVANVLTDAEYAAFKAFLEAVAGMGARHADMVTLLSQPCGDDGETGGLDFGCDDVRTLIDQFGTVEGMAEASAKLKGLGERIVYQHPGLTVGDVIRARRIINAA